MTSTPKFHLLPTGAVRPTACGGPIPVGNPVILRHYVEAAPVETAPVNDDTGWGRVERQRVTLDLRDSTIQVIVGNLLRFQALRNLLERGRTEEAADLLQRSMATQRATLEDLRTLTTKINPVV